MMLAQLKNIRKRCLELANIGGDANLQSCFSSVEILYALYHGAMKWSPDTATDPERDVFLLSKGQSSMALVAVLEDLGLFCPDEMNHIRRFGSRFSTQLDRTKFPEGGIEISAGSLGHGFPMAVGMAYAGKIQRKNNRYFVLVGDGEMNEGTTWEASAFAGAHGLANLTLVIDDNDSIGRMLRLGPFDEKLRAFGFAVSEVDGHSIGELQDKMTGSDETDPRPRAVIAHTVRGYGSRTLMSDNAWFHKAPNLQELELLKGEVDSFEEGNG